MIKVSVIVPIYNVEKYLCKCIDSLLGQTLQDIEIILVDDGSADRSPEICDTYALKDNRIKVIHKSNGGLSDARNVGLEVAKGEYIAFLDSDDWVDVNLYKYLYNTAETNKADIVQCDFVKVHDENIVAEEREYIKHSIYTGVQGLNLLYGDEYVRTVIACNKIYKRKLFEGIRFPENKIHEDEFTTYKLIHKSTRLIDLHAKMYYYRQRTGSISNEEFSIKRLDAIEAFKENINYYRENQLSELAKKAEARLCNTLKAFYVQAKMSNLKSKKRILKSIKKDMIKYYKNFMANSYITRNGKVTLTICLINGEVFFKLYSRYTKKDNKMLEGKADVKY